MKFTWKDCFKAAVTVFGLYLAITFWPAAAELLGAVISAGMPLLIGCVIAYVVNILMASYERRLLSHSKSALWHKVRRPVCMLLAFLTLTAIVVIVVLLVVPQLGSCFQVIVAGVPQVMRSVVEFIDEWDLLSEDVIASLENVDWQSRIGQIVQMVTSGLGSVVDVMISAVSSVVSWVVTAFMSLIFAIYLLSGKEKIGSQFKRLMHRYLPERVTDKVWYVLDVVNDCFHRYIVGQCTEAVILGVLCALGMALLGLPYAMMVGALIAFTALIPVAGAYIGAGVGAFMILTVDPWKAVVFLIFIVVLQQLEGNLIYPRVVGSSMGLPGIWVLAAVTVGGGIMGIGGMLLGVPIAAAVYRLLKEDVKRLEPQLPPEETEEPEVTIEVEILEDTEE